MPRTKLSKKTFVNIVGSDFLCVDIFEKSEVRNIDICVISSPAFILRKVSCNLKGEECDLTISSYGFFISI